MNDDQTTEPTDSTEPTEPMQRTDDPGMTPDAGPTAAPPADVTARPGRRDRILVAVAALVAGMLIGGGAVAFASHDGSHGRDGHHGDMFESWDGGMHDGG